MSVASVRSASTFSTPRHAFLFRDSDDDQPGSLRDGVVRVFSNGASASDASGEAGPTANCQHVGVAKGCEDDYQEDAFPTLRQVADTTDAFEGNLPADAGGRAEFSLSAGNVYTKAGLDSHKATRRQLSRLERVIGRISDDEDRWFHAAL